MAFVGLLLLVAPGALFLGTLPLSGRLGPRLRWTYRVLGGIVVLLGSAASLWLAAFSGDQGGIAAYFLQLAVISAYVALTVVVVGIHRFLTPPS